ncbi:Acyl-CoA N-acyltransferases (NAT) superfamily protein [Rhynchospora pubera]|uniref:Acyl-CoA N-acyltransferases (NAT) superfamily protein n=1 Tax=Rhynchospora pubera TaxID=906938 RepID=A0AAV8FTD7_9POAL|nr:Acyl-CoA N-acyltransferases (NAT) superfamily protein [Rhynchospora pubera]
MFNYFTFLVYIHSERETRTHAPPTQFSSQQQTVLFSLTSNSFAYPSLSLSLKAPLSFVEMEAARSASPILRPSPCGRVSGQPGWYEAPVATSIRPINPIFSSSSSLGLCAGRNEGLMLSSSGTKEFSAVRPMRPFVETEKSDVQFDRLQPSDQDLSPTLRRDFTQFTARVALIDLELWAAAWLRAETNYENESDLRLVERFKMQYAEQQYKAMKKQLGRKHYAQKCYCLVTVKNDDKNGKRSAIQSVVGTLDLHVRHPLHGELYPGEGINKPGICDIYKTSQPQFGYISNVCVSKHARRQGIGRNMMALAINISFSDGVEKVFIHVHRENYAAQNLYQQMGFKIVERDLSIKPSDDFLLSLRSAEYREK